ncbi:MAG: 50S ribosomal protein L18 [Deltaproteobacteria bacterium]|nr:MAG: 50S ribosomal protein L18 [Deltaproteobacteria bacterium]
MGGTANKRLLARLRRKKRIRKKIFGTPERPRLAVFRSAKHIYAQVIDDTAGVTLASASTLVRNFSKDPDKKGKVAAAEKVGELIAAHARKKGIEKVVFDRGGYIYHGRVKALADGARKGGLKF